MIQVYSPDNTNFEKNGDMSLFPTEATVHAVLNGSWEATLSHPIDPEGRWKYIVDQAVVKMPSFVNFENGGRMQLFRIKHREKSQSGITATMEPIFMDAMDDCFLLDVRPTEKTGQEALNIMTAANKKYSGKSNITKTSTAYYQHKNLIEAINGSDDNSFVNRWGGEILFNNFEVIINDQVGDNYGVELRYGRNLKPEGFQESVDFSEVTTRIYPKSYNGHTMTNDGYVDSPLINNYPTIKIAVMTFEDIKLAEDAMEDDAENGITICENQAALDAALKKRCQEQFEAGLDKPTVTVSADLVLLQDVQEYSEYMALEDVSLGDTILLRHSRFDIVRTARVIELTYDAARKKVSSVVLGDFTYNFFDNVSSTVNRINGAIRQDGTLVADKVAGFIDGAMASLKAQYNVAKKQDVLAILFENLDKTSPLYGAMALGTQGLLISKSRTSDNRDWDWTTALTANGLIADTIVAGLLADQTGKNYWNLDTGEMHAGNATFRNTSGNSSININGGRMRVEYENTEVGFIGANRLRSYPAYKGLVFDLETAGNYMTWAYRVNPGDDIYTMMMTFSRNAPGFTSNALNMGCDIDMRNYKISNSNLVASHAGVVSLGFVYYTDGTDQRYGYLEVVTTDRGTVGLDAWKSDGRLKENIADCEDSGLDLVESLPVRSFDWKEDHTHEKFGLIAQELEEIDEGMVYKVAQKDEDGNVLDEVYQIRAEKIIVPLVKSVQELKALVEKQQQQIDALTQGVAAEMQQYMAKERKVVIRQYPETIKFYQYPKKAAEPVYFIDDKEVKQDGD